MNKSIKFLLALLLPLTLCMGLSFLLPSSMARAEEEVTYSEAGYASLWVNDLGGYAADGATRDGTTGNITAVNSYGRFGYNGGYENVEISSIINFSTLGNTTFIMRATGDTVLPAGHSSWTNTGYYIRLYSNARYDFVKGSTVVHSAVWPPQSGFAANTDYKVTIKTVDLYDTDGALYGVKISLSVSDIQFFEHIDTTDKISGGWFAICSEGSVFSASGNGFSGSAINLADVATPVTSSNFPATIGDDGLITTSETGAAGASGVGYTFMASDFYSIKTKFTPSAAAGNLTLSIGAYKTNSNEMNRDNVVDETWGWAETGYVFKWSANGQRHIYRNGALLAYVWDQQSFVAGQEYEVEFGVTPFGDGSNRIHYKIDGVITAIFFDRPSENYTPLSLRTIGGGASSINVTSLVLSYSVASTISPYDKINVTEKTIATKDLGSATNSADIFDRNGAITTLPTGIVAGYNGNFQSTIIKTLANFTSTGSSLVFSLRAQGTLDTPWGGGWTNRGYQMHIYANGQTILYKGTTKICEGWSLSSVTMAANTDYVIEIGTIDLGGGAVRVYASINNSPVLNYVDINDALTNSGWFTIFNNSFVGKLDMYGVSKPTLSSNAENNECEVDDEVTLSALINDQTPESVTYFIDETLSTADATLSENALTVTSEGSVVVYCQVDGIYSDDLIITATQGAVPVVTLLPTQPLIVGGETHTVGYSYNGEIESVSFSIENLSGSAVINAQTGEITPVSAGNVKVYVTINGVKSEGYIINISPKIQIENTLGLAVGEIRELGYSANCPLPDETIITTYELIEGSEYAELNTQSGVITAKAIGIIRVRVTVVGQTFQAVSEAASIGIEAPVVVLLGVEDMYSGQTLTLAPKINDGLAVSSEQLVIVSGESLVRVEGRKITALKEGTVKIKAVVNGFESSVLQFVITDLTATIIVTDMPTESTQTLGVMLNFDEVEIDSVVYSIEKGSEFATINENVLTSFTQKGEVKIKANVKVGEKELIAYEIIDILYKVRLIGVTENEPIGSQVQLSHYCFDGHEENEVVEYVLVSGSKYATLSDDGVLKFNRPGVIKVKVIVDGVESETITITSYAEHNKLGTYIVWGAAGIVTGGVLIALVIRNLRKRKKSKKA